MDDFFAHILVIDDDEGIRSLVKKYLNENKYIVTTAESAEAAIEKIKLRGSNKIFIKMDIEGDEFSSLNEYIKSHNSVLGFAIEFHDINNRSKEFNDLIKKLKKSYLIAHIHGNNYSKVDQTTGLPSSVEITLINKKLIKEPTLLSNYKYPIDGLDQPNKHSRPDIKLKF